MTYQSSFALCTFVSGGFLTPGRVIRAMKVATRSFPKRSVAAVVSSISVPTIPRAQRRSDCNAATRIIVTMPWVPRTATRLVP